MIRFTGTTPPLAGRCQEIFFDPASPSNTVTGVVESSVGDRTTKDNTNVVYNGRSITTTGLQQMSGFVIGAGRSLGTGNSFGVDCSPLFTNPTSSFQDLCISFTTLIRNNTDNRTSFSFGSLNGVPFYTLTLFKSPTLIGNYIKVSATDNYLNASGNTRTISISDLFYFLPSPTYSTLANASTILNKWLNITVSVKRVVTPVIASTYNIDYTIRLFINGVEHTPYTTNAFSIISPATYSKPNGVNPWSSFSDTSFKLLSASNSYSKLNFRSGTNYFEFGGLGDVSLHDFRIYENNSSSFGSPSFGSRNTYANSLRNPILSPDTTNNLVLRYLLETGPQNIPNASITELINTTKNEGLIGILPVYIKGNNNPYNYALYPGPSLGYYSGYSNNTNLIKSIKSFGITLPSTIHDGSTSTPTPIVTANKTINASSTGNDLILFEVELNTGLDPTDYLVKDLLVSALSGSPATSDLFLTRYPKVELYGQRTGDTGWVLLLTYNAGDTGGIATGSTGSQTCSVSGPYYGTPGVQAAGTPGLQKNTFSTGIKNNLIFPILSSTAIPNVVYATNSPISPTNLATYVNSNNYYTKFQFRIVGGAPSDVRVCSASGGVATVNVGTPGGNTTDTINSAYIVEHIYCNVSKKNTPIVNNYSLGFGSNLTVGQIRLTYNFRERFNTYTTKHFDLKSFVPYSVLNNVGNDTISSGDNFYIPSYKYYTNDINAGFLETTGTSISSTVNPTLGTTGYLPAVGAQRLPTAETLSTSIVNGRELLSGESSAVVLPFLNQNWKGQPSSTTSIANTNNTITLRKRGKIKATASMVQSNQFVVNGGVKLSLYSSIDYSTIDLTGYTAVCNNNVSVPGLDLSQGQLGFTGIPVIYNLILTKSGSPTYHFPVAEGFGTIFYCSDPSLNVYAQFDGQPDWSTQDAYHYNFYNGFTFYTSSGNTLRVPIGTSGSLINNTQTTSWTQGVTNLGANKTSSWNNCESKIKFTSPEVLNILSLTAAANGTPITNNVSNSTPTSLVLTKTQVTTLCNTTTTGFKRMMFCIEKGPFENTISTYLSHLTFYRSDISEEGTAAVTQLDTYFK